MRNAALSVSTPCGFMFAFFFCFVCVCGVFVCGFCSDFYCADFCCADFLCADSSAAFDGNCLLNFVEQGKGSKDDTNPP